MLLRSANRLRPRGLGSARIGRWLASVVGVRNTPNRRQCSTRRFGVPLEHEDHGDGVGHAAGELGAIRIAVISADQPGESPAWRCGGSTFVGMWVPSWDAATETWSYSRRRCYCRTSKMRVGVSHTVRESGRPRPWNSTSKTTVRWKATRRLRTTKDATTFRSLARSSRS